MVTAEQLLEEIRDLKRYIADIEASIVISSKQVRISEGLSEMSDNLGTITAGEFRTGEGQPGHGFSGVRISYPGVEYGGSVWNIVGVDADTVQFGIRSSDGVAELGGGKVTLDKDGIILTPGTTGASQILWWNPNIGSWRTASIYGYNMMTASDWFGYAGGGLQLYSWGISSDAPDGKIQLTTRRIKEDETYRTEIDLVTAVDSDIINYFASTDGNYLRMAKGATIFNRRGEDVDFVIKTDNNDNMVYVDGGNDRVGIGTATPASIWHIADTSGSTSLMTVETNSTSGDPYMCTYLAPSLNNAGSVYLGLGTAISNRNVGFLKFYNNIPGSTANYMSLGLHTYPDLIMCDGGGKTTIAAGTDSIEIDYSGNLSFNGLAGLYPRVVAQDAQPTAGNGISTIDSNEMIFWIDTNDSNKCYLMYSYEGTIHKKLMDAA